MIGRTLFQAKLSQPDPLDQPNQALAPTESLSPFPPPIFLPSFL